MNTTASQCPSSFPGLLSYPAGVIKTGRRENLETKLPSVLLSHVFFFCCSQDGVIKIWDKDKTLLREILMGETLTVASFLNIQGSSCFFCLIINSWRLRTVDLFLLKVMWPRVTQVHERRSRERCLVLIPVCNGVVCKRPGWNENLTDFERKGGLQAV